MLKILLGGSPCTNWSILQKVHRETEPAGVGWELFLNYVIAKNKFQPDVYLYENNVSATKAIRDCICDNLIQPDGWYIEINSNLLSAQNRSRFYVHNCGDIALPVDKGITIEDILEWPDGYVFDAEYDTADCLTVRRRVPEMYARLKYIPRMFNAYNRSEIKDKAPTLSTGSMVTSSCATLRFEKCSTSLYEVQNGVLTMFGNQYRIVLPDGSYLLRKLTCREAERLQTLPDDYTEGVSVSQRYKLVGNGWTADVIRYILEHKLASVPRNEPLLVLSMYDGIATGRYVLESMGFQNITYHAYEIDKYAIEIAKKNYPDIIYHGDAFGVRDPNWLL